MRRMIGVLHRGDIELLGGASPGLAELGKLAERARASGLPGSNSHRRGAAAVVTGAGSDLFRIVQEALTNAIKRAGPAAPSAGDVHGGRLNWRSPTPVAPGRDAIGCRTGRTRTGGYAGASHPLRRPPSDRTAPGRRISVVARIPLTEPVLTVTRTFVDLALRRRIRSVGDSVLEGMLYSPADETLIDLHGQVHHDWTLAANVLSSLG